MLKKILIIVSCVSFMFALLVVPSFASAVVPGENYQEAIYEIFPCLDTTYSWVGVGNEGTVDNSVVNFASSAKITGNWQFYKNNANGFNTIHRFGGTGSYVTRYVRDRGGNNIWLQWYESFVDLVPSTFFMSCRDFITPRYESGVRDLKGLPVYRFMFNRNTSLDTSYVDIRIQLQCTVYDNDYLGNTLAMNETLRIAPNTMNINGVEAIVFVLDLNEVMENQFGDLYSEIIIIIYSTL